MFDSMGTVTQNSISGSGPSIEGTNCLGGHASALYR